MGEVNNNLHHESASTATTDVEEEGDDKKEAEQEQLEEDQDDSVDWLCVSRLPRGEVTREENLRRLLGQYGEVRHLHMVRSEVNGE